MAYMVDSSSADEQSTYAFSKTGKLQRAGEFLGIAAGKAVARSREFAELVRQRAERVKEEKPLRLLAVLAGVAAVAGFATRIWRSSGNA